MSIFSAASSKEVPGCTTSVAMISCTFMGITSATEMVAE
jgi:hypothetical protein